MSIRRTTQTFTYRSLYCRYVDEDSKDTYGRDAEQQLGYYDAKDVTDEDVMLPSHEDSFRPWYWLLRSTIYLCSLAGWEERLHPSTGRLLYVPVRRHGPNDMYYESEKNEHRVVWEKPDAVLEYEGMAGGKGSKSRWQYRLRHAIEIRTISVWRQLRYKDEPDFYYNIFTKQCQYEVPKEIEEMGEIINGLDGDQSMVAKMETSMNTGTLRRGRQKRKKRLEKKSNRYVALRQGKWEEMWCPNRRQFVYIRDADEDEDESDVEKRTKFERPISFVVDDDQLENVLPVQPDLSPPFLRDRHHAVLCILRGAKARAENRMVLCEWGCGKWMVQGERMRIHQKEECVYRITRCNFGCPLKMEAHHWVRQRAGHEKICPRRLVPCPLGCKNDIVFEELEVHKCKECPKRPFPVLECRHGCGLLFEGDWVMAEHIQTEKLIHEAEGCPNRTVRCTFYSFVLEIYIYL